MVARPSLAKTVGILALQGCVRPHVPHLEALDVIPYEVRFAEDLNRLDGLILPGGESTTMLTLLRRFDMWDALASFKKPVWGICAGAILMARDVIHPSQESLGSLDMTIERNAYGRQCDSHKSIINGYDVSYIRAPIIRATGKGITVLAKDGDNPVWVISGHHMATTFHAELTFAPPSPMHQKFIEMVGMALPTGIEPVFTP